MSFATSRGAGKAPRVKALGALFALALLLAAASVGSTPLKANAVEATGSISGTVTAPGATDARWPEAVRVMLFNSDNMWLRSTVLNSDGTYTLADVEPGQYKILFAGGSYESGSGWVSVNLKSVYNGNAATLDAAPWVTVTAGTTTAGIDAVLGNLGSITGTVTVPAGTDPLWWQAVRVRYETADSLAGDGGYPVGPDGTYTIDGMATGDYKVAFNVDKYWSDELGRDVPVNLAGEFYNNALNFRAAQVVTVAEGAVTSGIDASLEVGGSISGTVSAPGYSDPLWARGGHVEVFDQVGDNVGASDLDDEGRYVVRGLAVGEYRVRFIARNYSTWDQGVLSSLVDVNLVDEYYGDTLGRASAKLVAVVAGGTTSGIDGALETGATVNGTVTGPASEPDFRWMVTLQVHSATGESFGEGFAIAQDGSFAVNGLPAGTYTLGAHALPWAPLADPEVSSRTVTVGAAGTVTSGVTIALVAAVPAQIASAEHARLADLLSVASSEAPRCVDVAATYGVPADATGVFFNVTAADAEGPGNAVVYPDTNGDGSTPPPNSSTVNFESGRDVANGAFVQLPANGDVCTSVQGAKLGRLILDVTGYVTGNAGVSLMSAERVVDTRGGAYRVGTVDGPLMPGQITTVRIAGVGLVPSDAVGVIANVTVTGVSGPGHLKVWAADGVRPNTSVVNYAPGQDKANGQYLALNDEGKIDIESVASSADVIIDITGYVNIASPIVSTTPTRIVETRASEGIIGPITGRLQKQQIYSVEIPTSVVPAGATSVILNVTAVQPESLGHLRVYPDTAGDGATAPPETSTLNYIPGRDIPNMVVVQLPADRRVDFYSVSSTTDMVVDIVGYIQGPTG